MSQKAKNEKEVRIGLQSIQETKFSIHPSYDYSKIVDGEQGKANIGLELGHKIDYDLEKEHFLLDLKLEYKDTSVELILLEAEARFTFHVIGLKQVLKIDSENPNAFSLKGDFMPTLLNVAIGTMRGIVYAKTALHPLGKFPLPMIDMAGLLDNIVVGKGE